MPNVSHMTSPITKRLHVSGFTPALTPADLSQRLSNFGTVKALDGFGQVDAVGQPRKFGYVTIETTEANLKKCK
jgi:RNA recognition motif. (a.k.a. RRM, RBD, or RNP domain)